ncbi:TolC family outer membrane protein [Erythrobacter sp. LQ02-29]|uniref:TolC family outer membrane protein n=1 Tax=Erythrobacter sp. LQ02-29 TaxID=2920384 RepID=UPI001F4D419D|nr:TolC family outer membrane protein [Erythrobacter sp. LQ02-29]MCP9222083.1 TolC family outer membrane protein [Erythrobacter sp. LQ02-29]
MPSITRRAIRPALWLTASFLAAPLHAETLADALAKAYQSNPELEAQRARTRASDEVVTQAKAQFGPQITASGSYVYASERTNGPFGGERDGATHTYDVTLDQPLFASGQLAANLNSAEAGRLASLEQLRFTEQNMIADVVIAYVAVQRDLAIYRVRTQISQLLDEQFQTTSERLRLRDVTISDLEQTDNRRQVALAQAREALAALQGSAANYRRLVGNYPTDLAPLPMPPELPGLQPLYALAEEHSPQILASRYNELASRETLALRRAERGPVISGTASAQRSPLSQFSDLSRSQAFFVGVSVRMPLYTGGALTSRVREARELNEADIFDVEQARRLVRSTIGARWAQAEAATSATPIYENSILAAQRALEGVRRQEQAGTRTSRDVLIATNDLLESRVAAIGSAANGYAATVLALAEAGLLDVAQFGADVAPYDPLAYDPALSDLAGLPLRPLVDPLDSLVLDDGRDMPGVVEENDGTYASPAAEAGGATMPSAVIPTPRISGEPSVAPAAPPDTSDRP